MKKSVLLSTMLAAALAFGQEVQKPEVSADAKPKKTLKEAVGGFVVQPLAADAKYVTVVDSRKEKDGVADKFAVKVITMTHLAARVAEPKAGDVVVEIVDDGDFIVYPNKAKVVLPLAKNGNDAEKKLFKAFVYLLGVDGKFTPQSMGAVLSNAKEKGIAQVRRTTYRKACEEGWAPAPTNEFQKAIWEKVKAAKTEAAANPAEATEAK